MYIKRATSEAVTHFTTYINKNNSQSLLKMANRKPLTPEQRKKANKAAATWRAKNKESVLKYARKWSKKYREENREQINKYFRDYYKKNKEKHLVRVNDWKKRNPEKVKAYMKSEERNKYIKGWKANNPEKVFGHQEKYRKKKAKEVRESLEKSQSS